jgi:hypothetical protein
MMHNVPGIFIFCLIGEDKIEKIKESEKKKKINLKVWYAKN